MAEQIDVFFKVKYVKEDKEYDDLFENEKMFIAYSDLDINTPSPIEEDGSIYQVISTNYYPFLFEYDYKEKEYFYDEAQEEGIEYITIYFCDYSSSLERIFFGKIEIDVKNRKSTTIIDEKINYDKYLNKNLSEERKKDYEDLVEGEYDDEDYEEILYRVREAMDEKLKKEFIKYLNGTLVVDEDMRFPKRSESFDESDFNTFDEIITEKQESIFDKIKNLFKIK